jgi:transposase-like protein
MKPTPMPNPAVYRPMVHNSLKFVPWKDYKAVTADLKRIYQSMTEQAANLELDNFADKC